MCKILCFSSSYIYCSVSITDGDNVLVFIEENKPYVHSEFLVDMILQALSKAGLEYSDLDYLVLTVGPGSFTGIRVGLTIAKAILYTNDSMRYLCVNDFDIAYYRLIEQIQCEGLVFVILKGYNDYYYIQEFNVNHVVLVKPIVMHKNSLFQFFKKKLDDNDYDIVCCGHGLSDIYSIIKNFKRINCFPRFPFVKAIHIARYALNKINEGFSLSDPKFLKSFDVRNN